MYMDDAEVKRWREMTRSVMRDWTVVTIELGAERPWWKVAQWLETNVGVSGQDWFRELGCTTFLIRDPKMAAIMILRWA